MVAGLGLPVEGAEGGCVCVCVWGGQADEGPLSNPSMSRLEGKLSLKKL